MIGQSIQFNRRSAISVLLVVFMLTLAVTPALAWFDEGQVQGQAARPCRVISDGQAAHTIYCSQLIPHHPRPVAEQPLVRPAIARAEQMFISNQASTESMAQSTSDQ
jgi:hypothetical protein